MIFSVTRRPYSILIFLSLLLQMSVNLVSAEPVANKERSMDVRMDRLERLMSSQKQLEVLYRVKQLQQENQQLRGLLEEQSNEIHQLKQQQKDLYNDLSRRLNLIEGGANTAVVSSDKAIINKPEPAKNDLPLVIDKSSSAEPVDKAVTIKPTTALIKPMSAKDRQQEQKAYQKAYDELSARRYNKARDSFVSLIEKYPGGRYAHIAQYWVAESSYALHHYEQAIIDYQHLLDIYSLSPKKAEAELKKAYSYKALSNKTAARQTLNRLLITYPDTTEAAQAKRLLKQL